MSAPYVVHSGETIVHEPADLWTKALTNGNSGHAFELVEKQEGRYVWLKDGKPVAKKGQAGRKKVEPTTAEVLLERLDAEGITGAVLYPSIAHRAYANFVDTKVLTAFLDVYNDWVLDLANKASERLRPMCLLNVDDPAAAAKQVHELTERGAAGFVIPLAPGHELRYDMPPYEALWTAANALKKPLVMLAGANRVLNPESAKARKEAFKDNVPGQLSSQATSWYSVRKSITAIIFTGAFERYPDLRIGVVGYGAGWAPFTMVRGDEMQQVRPERTGPPTRVPEWVADEETIRQANHLREIADVAIDASKRSGTVGMAPEGVGFYFKDGDSFGDHFKKGVFMTFTLKGRGSLIARPFVGAKAMLWGHRYPAPPVPEPVEGQEENAEEALPQAQERLNGALSRVGADDKHRLASENTAQLFGL